MIQEKNLIEQTSNLFKASTISFPKPFHPNIYSTKTEPMSRAFSIVNPIWHHCVDYIS